MALPNSIVTLDAPTALHADEIAARAHVYRLLAGVFIEEPQPDFIGGLRSSESLAELADAGVLFDGDFIDPDPRTLADELAVEFTSLFLASGGFPPVESVRLTGYLQQGPTMALRALYHKHGFEVGRSRFHVYEDQLGVELLFVAELLDRMLDALKRGDRAGAAQLDKEVKKFWIQHLGRWVRGYAALIARATEHSFYREMAMLLVRFSQEEVDSMRLRITDEDQGRLTIPKMAPDLEQDRSAPVCGACHKKSRLADLAI